MLIAFPRQQWKRERAALYIHRLASFPREFISFPPLCFIRVFIPSVIAISLSLLYLLPSPLRIILHTAGT
jgi:hypothetical protein